MQFKHQGETMPKIPMGITNAIDELFKVRQDLKMLKVKDTELGTSIKAYMLDHGLDEIEAKKACASISMRPYPIIDPEEYLEALDGDIDKLLASVTVRIDEDEKAGRDGARTYLGKRVLDEIKEEVEVPVLNIKLVGATAKKPKINKHTKVQVT